jgi:hypothetical protein
VKRGEGEENEELGVRNEKTLPGNIEPSVRAGYQNTQITYNNL